MYPWSTSPHWKICSELRMRECTRKNEASKYLILFHLPLNKPQPCNPEGGTAVPAFPLKSCPDNADSTFEACL